jgi:hypothetical protein
MTLCYPGPRRRLSILASRTFDHSRFDPRTDPIICVQARRLRSRLARYYSEEAQKDEIVIERAWCSRVRKAGKVGRARRSIRGWAGGGLGDFKTSAVGQKTSLIVAYSLP